MHHRIRTRAAWIGVLLAFMLLTSPVFSYAKSSYWKDYFSDTERKAVKHVAESYTRSQIKQKGKDWKGLFSSFHIKNGSIDDEDIKSAGLGSDKIRGLDDALGTKLSKDGGALSGALTWASGQTFPASNLTGTYAALDGSQITNVNPGNITSGSLNLGTGSLTSGSVSTGTVTATTGNIGTVDLGTNTITDGNLTGDWNLGSGNLTTSGMVDGVDVSNYTGFIVDSSESDQGANGSGSSVKDLIDSIGSDEATIVFLNDSGSSTTTYTVSTGITIPSNIEVRVQKGARLSVASGQTVAINGLFEPGPYQVFLGDGSFTGLKYVRPEWWYTGSGTYKAAFEKALQSNVRCELIEGKEYATASNGQSLTISNKSNVTIFGGGILKFDDNVTSGVILQFQTGNNILIDGISFDGNIANGSAGNRQAINFIDSNDISVTNVNIHDTLLSDASDYDATGIKLINCSRVKLESNTIRNTDCSMIIRRSSNVVIANNYMSGGPSESVSLWGDSEMTTNEDITITGNIATKQLSASFVDGCTISSNSLENVSVGGPAAGYIARNVNVIGNVITKRINIGESGSPADIRAYNIGIKDNVFNLNDSYAIAGFSASELTIDSNNFYAQQDMGGGSFIAAGSGANPLTGLTIKDNNFYGNNHSMAYVLKAAGTPLFIQGNSSSGAVLTTGSALFQDTLDDGSLANVFIADNSFSDGFIDNVYGMPKSLRNNITKRTSLPAVDSASTLELENRQADNNSSFRINGTTNITNIAIMYPGTVITLMFTNALAVTDGGNLKLAGDFTTSNGSTLQLISDGTDWWEISRSSN